MNDELTKLIDEIVRPLIEADGGELVVNALSPDKVSLRLGGACAGCPGFTYTRDKLIAPLLRAKLNAGANVEISNLATRE